jgi:multidrug efflux pump subunit AcrB
VPEGVHVSVFADHSIRIDERLGILVDNGLAGLVLVFLVLLFFTRLRVAFWVTWGIPVVFLGTVFVMWVLGYTINMITMFGLIMVLGMLVDDAVVIAENIFARRQGGLSAGDAAREGTAEVFWPVVASSITTVGAFVPLMFVAGQMGRTMGALPWVVVAALLASAAEAFGSLPSHLAHALKDVRADGDPNARGASLPARIRAGLTAGMDGFTRSVVGPFARRVIGGRYWVAGVSIGLLLVTAGVLAGGRLQFTFFPAPDTNSLVARVRFPVGSPLTRTRRQVAALDAALSRAANGLAGRLAAEGPLVERVLVRYGQTSVHAERGGHLAQVEVELMDAEIRGISSDEVIAAWRRQTGRVPGLSSLTIGRMERGVGGRELDIRLVGGAWSELAAASSALRAALRTQEGVSNVEADLRPGKAELVLRVNAQGARLGLTTDALARQVRAAFYGVIVQRFQRGGDDVAVRVSYPPDHRVSRRDLERLTLALPETGGDALARVPLSSVATIACARGWAELTHLDRLRAVAVTADVDERVTTVGNVLGTLRPFLTEELPLRYPGVDVRLEGQRATQRETFASLQVGGVVGLLIVIAVLVLATDSWTMPVFVAGVIPFGIVGVVAGHLAMGYKMTMLGTMAAIGLAGVVINDAILVVEFYAKLRAESPSPLEALVTTVQRRFRPIVITSLTTIAGLLPMLLETSIQAQFLIPMAITLAFGLLTGTLGTLIVLPCALKIADDLSRGARRGAAAAVGEGRDGTPGDAHAP